MRCNLLLRRNFILLVIFLSLIKIQNAYAQSPELPNVVSSTSPTPAGLSRYIDFPVSLSNGIPDISIPIYTLSSSRLKVPISLSYHAGGIKVMDRTSTMGLGWTLSAGGVINRVIHGLPDELMAGNMVTNGGWLNTVWPADVKGNAYTLGSNTNSEICVANHLFNSYIAEHRYDYLWDGEPDIFYFSAPGIGGKFLYRNSPDASGQRAVVIPYQPLKISNPGSTPGFTITGSDGVVYQFAGAIDLNTVDKTGSNPNNAASAWHLTKMISADGTDQVTFIYGLATSFDVTKVPSSSIKAHYEAPYGSINPPPTDPTGIGDRAMVTTPANASMSMEQSSVLTEIITKSTDIVFNYSTLSVSMKPLQSIDVYSITNGVKQKIKTYTFTINQFAGGGANSLRLDAVTEVGYEKGVAVTNPPYKISYASADAPPYDSKAQDLWGYYNGQIYNTDLTMVNAPSTGSTIQFAPEKRKPDETSMKKGMIQSITYPTGGATTFSFEPNQITTTTTTKVPTKSAVSVASVNTMYMIPGNSTSGIDLTFTMPVAPSGYTIESYTFNFSGSVYSGCTNCINNKPQAILIDATSNSTLLNPILTQLQSGTQTTEQYTAKLTLTPGRQYRLYLVDQGVLASWDQSSKYRLGASIVQNLSGAMQTVTQTQTVLAGGLRIQKIDHTDSVTGQTLRKTYNYTKPYFICPSAFAGDYFDYFKKYLAKPKWTMIPQKPIREKPSDPYTPYTSNIYYLESPTFSVGGAGSTSVAYQEVEEMQTNVADGTSLGKTVYTFNTAIDYIPGRLPTIRIDHDNVRNQLLSTRIFKSGSSTPVKEIINTYNNVNDDLPETPGSDNIKFFIADSDFDWAQRGTVPAEVGVWSTPGCAMYNIDMPFTLQALYYNISRNFLISTTVKEYDGATPLTTTTNYTYGNYAHMQPTQVTTTDSKSQLKTQTISYPLDFANITATSNDALGIKNLQNLNVIASPIEKSSYVTNTSNIKQLVSSVFTTYHPNLPLPTQVSVTEFTIPPTNFTQASVVSGGLVKDLRYQPRINIAYDAATGNTTEQQKVNDVKQVYLWGYNGLYPVAKIVGSDYATVNAVVSQATIDANIGNDISLRNVLNNLRTDTRTAKTLITTYTYKPLVGLTSETDPNGRTTYYEYDSFNRLNLVRDKDNNILKKICYNYAGQQSVCSLIGNQPQSGTFTRSGCTGGAVGSQVIYTVPANKYTAATQDAANTLATTDVNTNGQAYANQNGTCTLPANVTVNGNSYVSTAYSIQFANTATGQYYSMYLNGSSSSSTTMPAGVYNVTFYPSGSGGSTTLRVSGYSIYGVSGTLSNINISNGSQVVIGY